MMAGNKKYESLSWNDCQCGCRCLNIVLGSQKYAIWSRGTDKKFHLDHGHRAFAGYLGVFNSLEAADRAVRRLAKPQFKKEFAEMQKVAKMLSVVTT